MAQTVRWTSYMYCAACAKANNWPDFTPLTDWTHECNICSRREQLHTGWWNHVKGRMEITSNDARKQKRAKKDTPRAKMTDIRRKVQMRAGLND